MIWVLVVIHKLTILNVKNVFVMTTILGTVLFRKKWGLALLIAVL